MTLVRGVDHNQILHYTSLVDDTLMLRQADNREEIQNDYLYLSAVVMSTHFLLQTNDKISRKERQSALHSGFRITKGDLYSRWHSLPIYR